MLKLTTFCASLLMISVIAHGQTIWSGERITFTKPDGADPDLEQNQDRITDNVWITRGNVQGIYNARTEDGYANFISPEDTEWAFGTTDDIGTLNFEPWQTAISSNPPGSIDQDMVVHLISDDIYIDIKFLTWANGMQGGQGGFSYERTTDDVASIQETDVSAELTVRSNPGNTNRFVISTGDIRFNDPGIYVTDISGQAVQFTSGHQGQHEIVVTLTNGIPGTYILVIRDGNSHATVRLIKS